LISNPKLSGGWMLRNVLHSWWFACLCFIAMWAILLTAAAGCDSIRKAAQNAAEKSPGELLEKGAAAGAQAGAQILTANYPAAARTIFDYIAWAVAGVSAPAAAAAGVKLRKLTKPYDRGRDGERRTIRRPPPPDSPPPMRLAE
jgi:hypothetical protein